MKSQPSIHLFIILALYLATVPGLLPHEVEVQLEGHRQRNVVDLGNLQQGQLSVCFVS